MKKLERYLNASGPHRRLAAGSLILIGVAWAVQLSIALLLFRGGLFGDSSLPQLGSQLGLWVAVGLVTAIVGLVLVMVGTFTFDYGRHCHLVARVSFWQAAVGSALLFSVAVSDPDGATRDGSAVVGLYLLMPATIGILAALVAEMWDHRARLDERAAIAAAVVGELASRGLTAEPPLLDQQIQNTDSRRTATTTAVIAVAIAATATWCKRRTITGRR